jgi:sugar lactone lactonase YvrE
MRPAFCSSSLVCFLCLILTGCSLTTTSAPTPEAGLAIQGKVMGGQQPIVGSHVYLFAANTTGNAGPGIAASAVNASASLLNAALTHTSDSIGAYVLTDASGNFTITADYVCTPNTQVYVYALGGNPSSGVNLAAGLLAALGNCPVVGNFLLATPFITVNEISTVAAAYAFAGYATDATHVSSSGSTLAQTGIKNAFANAVNLAGISTGAALATTPAGNGTVPQSEINTLGNILAACINSASSASAPCGTLLSNAMNGTITPTDTATAAINIAHNPGTNITNLYALSTANPPFAPALTAQPLDFTVALSFTGGGLNDPVSIAVDGNGNVWTANGGNISVSQFNGVTGAAISPAGGYTGNGLTVPFAIAIDPSGNAWVNNMYPSSPPSHVSVFKPGGTVFTGSPFSGGGLSTQNSINATSPRDIAFDASGNAWIANLSGTATELNGLTGAAISPSTGFPIGTSTSSESGVAVDSAGHVWISGMNGNVLYELAVSTGATLGASARLAGGLEQPYSIAIDASNNIWLPNNFDPNTLVGTTVSKFTSVTTGVAFTGGGVVGPDGVAIDGAGNVWVSNQIKSGPASTAGVSELNNSGAPISPAGGYTSSATMGGPNDVAVDSSGNVWLANAFVPVTFANGTNVVELVGAAVPVVTPIATAVKNGTIGARP